MSDAESRKLRNERLASALRENLRRRKDQTRARRDQGENAPQSPPKGPTGPGGGA